MRIAERLNTLVKDIETFKLVLKLAVNETTKLAIMHGAFISDKRASAILDELVNRGLISYKQDTKKYRITIEGQKWLDTIP